MVLSHMVLSHDRPITYDDTPATMPPVMRRGMERDDTDVGSMDARDYLRGPSTSSTMPYSLPAGR